jgi:hypothetical protein
MRRVHLHDASHGARAPRGIGPARGCSYHHPVAPAAGAHTARAASATATPATPTPAPATRASAASAPAASASPSPSPTSACIMLSRPMRSLPVLDASRTSGRALNGTRVSPAAQRLTRPPTPHTRRPPTCCHFPCIRPRKHESSSTADRGERKGADARAGSAERHEGADYLQRQAAAGSGFVTRGGATKRRRPPGASCFFHHGRRAFSHLIFFFIKFSCTAISFPRSRKAPPPTF